MEIRVPGDKSISHRALLLGALARGSSRVRGILPGADPAATAEILRAMGVPVPAFPAPGEDMRIPGVGLRGLRTPSRMLDCANSGTTARLLLGVLAGQPLEATLTGDDSLRRRPMARVVDPLTSMGALVREAQGSAGPGRLPLTIRGGPLRSLQYTSPVASAQVKSALLLAGLVGGARVEIVEPRRSRDHTERMLTSLGIQLEEGPTPDGGWRILMANPPGSLPPLNLEVPGDPSSAAFFLAFALLGSIPLVIRGVGVNPTRTGLFPVLARMGAEIDVEPDDVAAGGEPVATLSVRGGDLRATDVGGDEIPALIDEIPVIAILAARAEGTTRITGAEELRVKESDRIRALVENLRSIGVKAEELPDGLVVTGTPGPLSGKVRTHQDHRIAMAFGVLAALPGNTIQVDGAGVVDVSFPGFWELLREVAATPQRSGGGAPGSSGVSTRPEGHGAAAPDPGLVITLDGPAGSGKSSTAREVARRLGLRHLDSGSLYRGLTVGLLEAGVPDSKWVDLTREELDAVPLRLEAAGNGFQLRLGDRVLGTDLREPQVTTLVPVLAGIPAVRAWLLETQRGAARLGGLVADGRDMGTVVFPGASLKVFLTAELEERARRRLLQDGGDPSGSDVLSGEAERLEARDRSDRERPVSPLRPADDAMILDTTLLSFEEQVERIVGAAGKLLQR